MRDLPCRLPRSYLSPWPRAGSQLHKEKSPDPDLAEQNSGPSEDDEQRQASCPKSPDPVVIPARQAGQDAANQE
jgi:hypothetical protein